MGVLMSDETILGISDRFVCNELLSASMLDVFKQEIGSFTVQVVVSLQPMELASIVEFRIKNQAKWYASENSENRLHLWKGDYDEARDRGLLMVGSHELIRQIKEMHCDQESHCNRVGHKRSKIENIKLEYRESEKGIEVRVSEDVENGEEICADGESLADALINLGTRLREGPKLLHSPVWNNPFVKGRGLSCGSIAMEKKYGGRFH